jgi:hypothetical protein
MTFPVLPPYTIPKADADLWHCGVVIGKSIYLKECARCGDYFEATKRHHALCCPRCKQISALVVDLREAARKAPYEPVRLTAEQVGRLDYRIRQYLDFSLHLCKPLDPEDGIQVVGYPYVGIRRAFIRCRKGREFDSSGIQRYLRRAVVEICPGAAAKVAEKILGPKVD